MVRRTYIRDLIKPLVDAEAQSYGAGRWPLVYDDQRADLMGQTPFVIWFTGLSGAGKSTLAELLDKRLHDLRLHTYILDGDVLREGMCRDLGFSDDDRAEKIRRAGEIAKLMTNAGLIVLCAFVSPFRDGRAGVRKSLPPGAFIEVFVDTPLIECQRRDPKGLYAQASAQKKTLMTGIDSPYEPPQAPELHLKTEGTAPEILVEKILQYLVAAHLV